MNTFETDKIKNITLAGHNGSGKTSLAEALLYKAGATARLGKIADGTTVCDYEPEEIKRNYSLSSALASFNYNDVKINILDTPGLFDFAGSMYEGIYAGDTTMITVSAKSGVRTGTKKAYDLADELKKSKMFVITKIDDENANFYNVLTDLKTEFGPTVCPVIVPVINERKIISYVNLIEMKAYKYDDKGNAIETEMPTSAISEKMEYRLDGLIGAISEAVAETDEELMEKFFDGEEFTKKEIIKGIHKGMNDGVITPVVCVSSTTLAGVDMLLKEFSLLLPTLCDRPIPSATAKDGSTIEVPCNSGDPVSSYVFKTVADPFVGKMSFMKVMSGTLNSDSELVNATTGQTEKIGKIYKLMGKKQAEISSASAGDIAVTTKISANTSETLCDSKRIVSFDKIEFPKPCYSMSVRAKTQGDEGKISTGLRRLLEEDLTLSYNLDSSTGEQILSGLGEQHLESAITKLKSKFGANVELSTPKVAYKETIRKKVKVEGKHKKQTGGHGQFGHVWIEFEPCVSDELVFEEKIFGGAVPRNYFPAVEKGLQEAMKKGVLAGCPVTGLKAILVDGSYHPVDSSEMAFKIAASLAYKEGLKQADPIMLEPIENLSVIIPDENTGDVMGELNKRRGRVVGMNPMEKNLTEICAEVPTREMHDFTMYIRQVTKGMGSFSTEFLRYEPLPHNLLSEVIASVGEDSAE